jgi:hypothetical protein
MQISGQPFTILEAKDRQVATPREISDQQLVPVLVIEEQCWE